MKEGEEEKTYYVSPANKYYHKYTCSKLNKSYCSLVESECIYWGYTMCPHCMKEEIEAKKAEEEKNKDTNKTNINTLIPTQTPANNNNNDDDDDGDMI